MPLTAWQLFKSQLKKVPPAPVADLTGKTILVTGANTGLGYAAAEHFANMKPGKVILACRNKAKGDEAVARLKKETGFSNIQLRLLDLASFSSTIEFANAFEEEEERLDILVANAAIARESYVATDDGWESSLQINNLSTLLLNIRLLPLMFQTGTKFSVEPRLVVVSSGMHCVSKLEKKIVNSAEPLKAFSSKEYCTPSVMAKRYPDTKLLNIFMTRPLAKILEKTPVVASLVCPGYCYSELQREIVGTQRVKKTILSILDKAIARTSDEGARQFIWAALADNTDGRMRSAYCDSMKIVETSAYSLSAEGLAAEDMLWADMIKVLSEVDPKVSTILRNCQSFQD